MNKLGLRAALAGLLAFGLASAPDAAETRAVAEFGPNPGRLAMYVYVPDGLPPGAPLVVALHGCTQQVEHFDNESGWTELADRLRFTVLFPEQQPANQDDRCFRWFSADHNRRDQGEASSIRHMIEAALTQQRGDRARVYVTGLSAGAAMTAVMLATYPELFKGGAIIAGVPFGCASTTAIPFGEEIKRNWTRQYGEGGWAALACGIGPRDGFALWPAARSPSDWRTILGEAGAPAPAAWPKVSLWHGTDDRRVHVRNLEELIEQWTAAHGIDRASDRRETRGRVRVREYKDARGETKVEAYEVMGLGHAVPVAPGAGAESCGREGEHFGDAGICAAAHIARFWGLATPP